MPQVRRRAGCPAVGVSPPLIVRGMKAWPKHDGVRPLLAAMLVAYRGRLLPVRLLLDGTYLHAHLMGGCE
jgi:hypothetical protein